MKYKIMLGKLVIGEECDLLTPAQIEKYERTNNMMFLRIDLLPQETIYIFERYKPELYDKRPWEMN